MAYCEVNDLLVGEMGDNPVSPLLQPSKFIDDAADEMDSQIGFRYQTPINVEDSVLGVPRPVRLLLKRINSHLASGRFIMAAVSAAQDNEVHSYGIYLVTESLAAIAAIAAGDTPLPGALAAELPPDEAPNLVEQRHVLQYVHDATSGVDHFYDQASRPLGPGFGEHERLPWGR
jgi:hypothetical protein